MNKLELLVKELYDTAEDIDESYLYHYLSDLFGEHNIAFTDENVEKVYDMFYDKYGFDPEDLTRKKENYSKIINPIEPEI